MRYNTSTYNIENKYLYLHICVYGTNIKVFNKLPMMALFVPKSYNNYLSYIHVNFKNNIILKDLQQFSLCIWTLNQSFVCQLKKQYVHYMQTDVGQLWYFRLV